MLPEYTLQQEQLYLISIIDLKNRFDRAPEEKIWEILEKWCMKRKLVNVAHQYKILRKI